MHTTRALIEQDASALQAMASSTTPHQTLTGQEMRQRAAIQSNQRRVDNQRAHRAKYSVTDLKAQVKMFASKAEQPEEDTPELLKLFTMVTESGMPPPWFNVNNHIIPWSCHHHACYSQDLSVGAYKWRQNLSEHKSIFSLKVKWCPQGLLRIRRHWKRYYWTLGMRSLRDGSTASSPMDHSNCSCGEQIHTCLNLHSHSFHVQLRCNTQPWVLKTPALWNACKEPLHL